MSRWTALRWMVNAYVSVMRYRMIPATSHGCFSALIPDAMMRRTPVTPWMTANG